MAQLHGSLGCQTGDPGISHSSAKRCKQKPKTTIHDAKGKRKPQTKFPDHKKTTIKPLLKVTRSISVHFGGFRDLNILRCERYTCHEFLQEIRHWDVHSLRCDSFLTALLRCERCTCHEFLQDQRQSFNSVWRQCVSAVRFVAPVWTRWSNDTSMGCS